MPTPHKHDWVKVTPFGDYRDPKQNHKDTVRNTEQYNLVRMLRFSGRHVGSKSMHALRSHITKNVLSNEKRQEEKAL